MTKTTKLRVSQGGKMHGPVGPLPGTAYSMGATRSDFPPLVIPVEVPTQEAFDIAKERVKVARIEAGDTLNLVFQLKRELDQANKEIQALDEERRGQANPMALLRAWGGGKGLTVHDFPFDPELYLIDRQGRIAGRVDRLILEHTLSRESWVQCRDRIDLIPEDNREPGPDSMTEMARQIADMLATELGVDIGGHGPKGIERLLRSALSDLKAKPAPADTSGLMARFRHAELALKRIAEEPLLSAYRVARDALNTLPPGHPVNITIAPMRVTGDVESFLDQWKEKANRQLRSVIELDLSGAPPPPGWVHQGYGNYEREGSVSNARPGDLATALRGATARRLPRNTVSCPTCKGEGHDGGHAGPDPQPPEDCETCHGRGRIADFPVSDVFKESQEVVPPVGPGQLFPPEVIQKAVENYKAEGGTPKVFADVGGEDGTSYIRGRVIDGAFHLDSVEEVPADPVMAQTCPTCRAHPGVQCVSSGPFVGIPHGGRVEAAKHADPLFLPEEPRANLPADAFKESQEVIPPSPSMLKSMAKEELERRRARTNVIKGRHAVLEVDGQRVGVLEHLSESDQMPRGTLIVAGSFKQAEQWWRKRGHSGRVPYVSEPNRLRGHESQGIVIVLVGTYAESPVHGSDEMNILVSRGARVVTERDLEDTDLDRSGDRAALKHAATHQPPVPQRMHIEAIDGPIGKMEHKGPPNVQSLPRSAVHGEDLEGAALDEYPREAAKLTRREGEPDDSFRRRIQEAVRELQGTHDGLGDLRGDNVLDVIKGKA